MLIDSTCIDGAFIEGVVIARSKLFVPVQLLFEDNNVVPALSVD